MLEVYNKKITAQEADEIYRSLITEYQQEILPIHAEDFLCFSVYERTAIMLYGIPFDVVARWRYEGWPDTCIICGKSMNFEKGGWRTCKTLRFKGKNYPNAFFHWDCYSAMPKNEDNKAI